MARGWKTPSIRSVGKKSSFLNMTAEIKQNNSNCRVGSEPEHFCSRFNAFFFFTSFMSSRFVSLGIMLGHFPRYSVGWNFVHSI